MSNYEAALLALASDPEELAAKAKRRQEGLVRMGHTPTEALVMDEAFASAVHESVALIGRTVDGLAPDLQVNALLYIMRGVVGNLDTMEDFLVEMTAQEALARGVPIVVSGGAPGCDCPTCTAARLTNATMGTRH